MYHCGEGFAREKSEEIPSTLAIVIGAVTFALATIGINIVANFVGPSYDFANAFPKYIDFKRGV